MFVGIGGVGSHAIGAISAISCVNQIATFTLAVNHGLQPGAEIQILGTSAFDGAATVLQVVSPTVFSIVATGASNTTAGAAGSVYLLWPIPDSSIPTTYEVLSAPTATTFQVQLNYCDGTWSSGGVTMSWEGTFFVSSVISLTSFTYQQYGPGGTAGATGTVTPFGQIAPGVHQMEVMYLTRQGYLTAPSPPVKFVANGGQYLTVSNIPIGPSNVVARVLAFTGALGAYFFYIPVPAQEQGQTVSTATQVNDNTTTSVVLDFSDNTLFKALGVSIPGNTPANQVVLDSVLGFGYHDSRLLAYGSRSCIQNLLNLGFDGGALPSAPTVPAGWTGGGAGSGGALTAGRFNGGAWLITMQSNVPQGSLQQTIYQDYNGDPIANPNTQYRLRVWLQPDHVGAGSVMRFDVTMSSSTTGFSSTASIVGAANFTIPGKFVEAEFSAKTPDVIPSDLTLSISATSLSPVTLLVDEISIIYSDSPYTDQIVYASYVDNPESFDRVTGKFGPANDTHKIMDLGIVRGTLYLLTQDPSGRIHSVVSTGTSEPAGWTVDEVAANCGALSTFCLSHSQADDASAGGGEEWFVWASASGARIFGGDQPWKISQEIQPDWDRINQAARLTIWTLNDPIQRVVYFGLPMNAALAPNLIYPMSYRQLDTPYQIAMAAPVHTSFSGKLIATDNTRKWTRWNLSMNGAAALYRIPGVLSICFLAGNGQPPGASAGYGNVYALSSAKLTDDDYGLIQPYYTTFFFVSHEAEQALQLGAHRKMLSYFMAQLQGVGQIVITALCNNLSNPWPLVCLRTLTPLPNFDVEWAGGNVQAQRIAFKLASVPMASGTDNSFLCQKLVAAIRPAAHMPVRGAN